ncbi:MAG: sigma-70 family RNA polymerase sigma factor [Bacteroidota bacterium]
MSPEDASYLQAIQNNDARGLRTLYRTFLPRISRFIELNGGSAADAEDVFQDALIIIYKKSKAADFRLSSKFYTLLYGVCRNLWGNRLQKKSRTEVELKDDYKYERVPDVGHFVEQAEEQRLFWDAFQKLGKDCQQLMKLFFAKVKMEVIAKQLNLSSVGYAKKKKYKCKENLIKLVKADRRYAELKVQ